MTAPEIPELPIMMAVHAAIEEMTVRANEVVEAGATDQHAALRAESYRKGALAAIVLVATGRLENEIRAARAEAGLSMDSPLDGQGGRIELPEMPGETPVPSQSGLPIAEGFAAQMQAADESGDVGTIISELVNRTTSALALLEGQAQLLRSAVGVAFPQISSGVMRPDHN